MAELIAVERVYGDGQHNAFTDLIRWKGSYYLTFRASESHGLTVPGHTVVMRSADSRSWEVVARIHSGGDDRDPKFVDAGDRLAINFATWYPRWCSGSIANQTHDLISQVCFSRDGLAWSAPRQTYGPNYWLWRICAADGRYYCAAYHFPVREERLMRSIHLLVSDDLLKWTLVAPIRWGGGGGEPVLYQPEAGRLRCIIRAVEPDSHSWYGESVAPYSEWAWSDFGVMVHAPVVVRTGDEWLVAGRSRPEDIPPECNKPSGAHASLWRVAGGKGRHELTVPSAGDCSYCGFAWGPDRELLMSYYSQHERLGVPPGPPVPADIFLARVRI